jgi:tetratricopeptide (TPR) repeat protein
LRRAGDAAGVEAVLRALVETATPANGVARWTQLATHLEASGRRDDARTAWQTVRSLDPGNAMAWEGEERFLEAQGPSPALLETLLAHARNPIAAGHNAGAIYLRAAQVAQALGDVTAAVTHAEWARHFLADDPDLLDLMEQLYAATNNAEALAAVRARIAQQPPRRIAGPAAPAVLQAAPMQEPASEPEPSAPRMAPARIAPPAWLGSGPAPAAQPAVVSTAAPSAPGPALPPMIRPPTRADGDDDGSQ